MTTPEIDFPWLPEAWVTGIVKGDYVKRVRASGSDKALKAWLAKRPKAKEDPCKQMQRALDTGLENLAESASGAAHDELNDRVFELVKLSVEGHCGVWTALRAIQRSFIREVTSRRAEAADAGEAVGTVRTRDEANAEFQRELYGAIRIIKGHHEQPEMVAAGLKDGAAECTCDWVPEGDGERGAARDPYTYELTETGNAEQLRDLANGDLCWVPAYGRWLAWDHEKLIWAGREYDLGIEWARKLAPRIKLAGEHRYRVAEQVEGSDQENALTAAKKLMTWADKCGSAANLSNTLKVAKSYPDMVCAAEAFDGNSRIIHCADGTVVELNDDGASVRPSVREDRCSLSTGVPYAADARSPLWESYLRTFLPDEVLRDWVQRLFGYALLGANPRGALVFLHGPTGSGKSTIVESVGAALGGYGSTFDLSVFRASQDARPRPDLVHLLTRRLVYASEAGSEWHLHADQTKKLTGGDTVSAYMKFGNDQISRIPAFTPFIATNSVPRIPNADPALWRRLIAVPFDQRMAGDDPLAAGRLRDEPENRRAILAWLVRGWHLNCQRSWHLDVPAAVRARTRDFQSGVSNEHTWLYECCDVTGDAKDRVVVEDLLASYTNYMLANGIRQDKIKNKIAFTSWLGDHSGLIRIGQRYPTPRMPGDKKKSYWGGVRIKGEEADDE